MIITFSDGQTANINDDRINQLMPWADAVLGLAGGKPSNFADAGEAGAFMISQLAYVEQKIYEVQRVPLQYARLVPVTSEAGAEANSIVYQVQDFSGQFKRVAPNARDLPKAEVGYAQVTLNVANGGGSYEYNVQEMRESAFLRRPLNVARAKAADVLWQQHLNNVALIGETAYGLYGLLNMNTVPTANAPVGSWGNGTTTEVQVISDIAYGLQTVWQNSAYNDLVDTILVPPSVMNYLSRAFVGTNAFVSLLKYIQENNISKNQGGITLEFQAVPQLETLGSGNTRRIMFYKKDPDRVKFHSTKDLTFLAPQFQGLSIVMNGDYRYAGIQYTYPKSALYLDNV